MSSQKNPKYFQILLTLSLILGAPVALIGYSSQAKAPQSNLLPEQNEVFEAGEKHEKSDDGDQMEAVEKQSFQISSALGQISESGEDAYDSVKVGNWLQAQKQLSTLRQAQSKLADEMSTPKMDMAGIKAGISDFALAIVNKNQMKAMDAANRITLHAIQITATFKSVQPLELSMLDYLGRELELAALARDASKIQDTIRQIIQTWEILKPNVQAHGGSVQAKHFDTVVQHNCCRKNHARLSPACFD